MSEVKRERVSYRHDAIYPEFLNFLARIGAYAGDKYTDPLQYRGVRMVADRGPINHARNHIGEYQMSVQHDHFGDDPRWQLAAAAYNLMMEFVYVSEGHAPDVWPKGNPLPEAIVKRDARPAATPAAIDELLSRAKMLDPQGLHRCYPDKSVECTICRKPIKQ